MLNSVLKDNQLPPVVAMDDKTRTSKKFRYILDSHLIRLFVNNDLCKMERPKYGEFTILIFPNYALVNTTTQKKASSIVELFSWFKSGEISVKTLNLAHNVVTFKLWNADEGFWAVDEFVKFDYIETPELFPDFLEFLEQGQ